MNRFTTVWNTNGRLVECKSYMNNQDTCVFPGNVSGFLKDNAEKTDECIKVHR